MSKKIDMAGRRFGLLTVTGPAGSKNGKAMWACRCDCGAAVTAEGSNLRRGPLAGVRLPRRKAGKKERAPR